MSSKTALVAACERGYEDIVRMLLKKNAHVNAPNGSLEDALRIACQRGYKNIFKLLLDKGVNVNAETGSSNTALVTACEGGYEDIVEILLEKEADVNAPYGSLGNALWGACEGDYENIAEWLLDKGADLRANMTSYTEVLVLACAWGHATTVQRLLDSSSHFHKSDFPIDLGGIYNDEIEQILTKAGNGLVVRRGSNKPGQAGEKETHSAIMPKAKASRDKPVIQPGPPPPSCGCFLCLTDQMLHSVSDVFEKLGKDLVVDHRQRSKCEIL